MPTPKSVVKFKKNGIEYTSSVDYASYTIKELSRAALRDVGKLLSRYANQSVWNAGLHVNSKIVKGKLSPFQYWVRSRETDLQVGVEHEGHKDEWYGVSQELGTSGMPKLAILTNTARENIDKIVEIESKYLTAMQSNEPDLSGTDEGDYEGGSD